MEQKLGAPAVVRQIIEVADQSRYGAGRATIDDKGEPGYMYTTIKGHLPQEQIDMHLRGESAAMVYLQQQDNRTQLAVLDFDNKEKYEKRLGDDEFRDLIRKMLPALDQRGLRPLICRSRSGTGYNLWFRWDELQNKHAVAAALLEIIRAVELDKGDGGVGVGQVEIILSAQCLPLFGDNPLLNPDTLEPVDNSDYFNWFPSAPFQRSIEQVASSLKSEPPPLELVAQALEYVSADSYSEWVDTLLSLKSEYGDDAKDLARAWSETSEQYDAAEFERKWSRDIRPNRSRGVGSLFHDAQESGWVKPAHNIPWQQPVDLFRAEIEVPAWPSDFLPGYWGQWAADVAYRMQTHIEFPAAGLIVSVATAAGAFCLVQPKRNDSGFKLAPRIFANVIADSGTKKTPALDAGLEPLIELDRDAGKRFKGAYKAYMREHEQWKALKSAERPDKREPEKPVRESIIVHNSTTEQMAAELLETPQGYLHHVDELAALVKRFDSYRNGKGGDMEFILSAHSGSALNVRRRERGKSFDLPYTYLSIIGTTQPKVAAEHFAAKDKVENGFAARFSLTLWPKPLDAVKYVDQEPDADALAACSRHTKAIRRTFAVDDAYGDPTVFCFDDSASEVYAEWNQKNAVEVLNAEQPFQEHYRKYDGFVAQLALIHWLMRLEVKDNPDGDPYLAGIAIDETNQRVKIDAVSARAAVDLVETVLKPHARKVYGVAAESAHADDARKIASWLLSNRTKKFTVSNLFDNRWSGLQDRKELKPVLDYLRLAGWIEPKGTRAREDVFSTWVVNPQVHRRWGSHG